MTSSQNELEGNEDELREGSAFMVQDSNGPGSRCRKGSLNMRNKLNNKGVKNKLLKTYNQNIQKMNAFKQSSAYSKTN